MLIEELFRRGIMVMGPSKDTPPRQIGVFNTDLLTTLPALRAAEMEKLRWLVGTWSSVNRVPATSLSPAYTDTGSGAFTICDKGTWLCRILRDGRESPHITFDPFSRQWIYLLAEGAYGILRSPGWEGSRIVFTGHMTMIGVDCQWRLTWTKIRDDEFTFLNEELQDDGCWVYIDEWEFRRIPRET